MIKKTNIVIFLTRLYFDSGNFISGENVPEGGDKKMKQFPEI